MSVAEHAPRPVDAESAAAARPRARRRRLTRGLGNALIVLGLLVLAYAAAVLLWRDPVTDLYVRWQQRELAAPLEREFERVRVRLAPELARAPAASDPAVVRRAARRFAAGLELGDAIGRIRIPRLGIDPIFLHGTRWGPDLSRGPGHYPETSVPGLGRTTAVAGHRTTFGAPFRHIDDLRPGDPIRLEVPYGSFEYRVTGHRIVDNDDWSIIRERGFDRLVLSACHPLYSAKQRWIVFARLVAVRTPDGAGYRVRPA